MKYRYITSINRCFACFAFLFLGFLSLGTAEDTSQPRLVIEKIDFNLGDIQEGKIYKYNMGIKNTGKSDLYIKALTPSCDCVSILEPRKGLTLEPQEGSVIKFSFDSTGVEGSFNKLLYIYSNDPTDPVKVINIKGRSSLKPESIFERAKKLGLLVVITSGLVDGINPCAFTVLVFFVSFLSFSGYKRRQIIYTGLTFIFAVFLTYLLLGLGIFRLIQGTELFRRIADIMRLGIGLFAIVLGFVSVYDFIVYRKTKDPEKIKLKLPQVVKRQIQGVIRERTDIRDKGRITGLKIITASFVCGFIVSLLESVCTGQTYLPTIMFMLRLPTLRVRALLNLVIYNFMFILPLLIILIFGILGTTTESFAKIAHKNLGVVKLATAIIFFILGLSLFLLH